MSLTILSAVFLIGLLGGVHCAGMCGGIVTAFAGRAHAPGWPLHLSYNLGRVGSYSIAGAIAGTAGSLGLLFDGVLPIQQGLYILANLMLVSMGLYLAGFTRVAAGLERMGLVLWRRIQPATRRLLPADTLPRAFGLGMLWGWLPCGMVYAVLTSALVSGDAASGAAVMAAFGLGTLPNLMIAGLAMRRLAALRQVRTVRLTAGALVLGFGVYGLAHASTLGQQLRGGLFCLS
jgi:sulfite exporter TauE/SafE